MVKLILASEHPETMTVLLSNGTTIRVQCLMDGVLNIPFDKNADGLTFMIYGREMNPSMFIDS